MNVNDRDTLMKILNQSKFLLNIVFLKDSVKCNEFVLYRFVETVKACNLMTNLKTSDKAVNFNFNSLTDGQLPTQVVREVGEVAAFKQNYDQANEGIILEVIDLQPDVNSMPATLQTSYCRRNGSKVFVGGEITFLNSDGRTLKVYNEMNLSPSSCITVISTVSDTSDAPEYSIYESKGAFHRYLKERVKSLGSDKFIYMLGKFISTPNRFSKSYSFEEIQEFCKALEVVILKGYTDRPILGHYIVIPSIKINNQITIANPKVIIAPGCTHNIIGMDILSKFHYQFNANSRILNLIPVNKWTSVTATPNGTKEYLYDFSGLTEPLMGCDYIEDDPNFNVSHLYVEAQNSPYNVSNMIDNPTEE